MATQIYGRLERVVKWLKIMLIIALCVIMIMINVGGKYLVLYSGCVDAMLMSSV